MRKTNKKSVYKGAVCTAPQTNSNPMPKPNSGPMNSTSAYMTRKGR